MSAGGNVMFSPSRKRPAPDEPLDMYTPLKMAKTELTDVSTPSKAATDSSVHLSAPESPLSSIAGTLSPPPGGMSIFTAVAGQKRKKRTAAEIEEEKKRREAEREAKRIALEEKRQKKEEEERIKQEQKRKLAEEREEKRREKEIQAQVKEQERKEKQQAREIQLQAKEQEKKEKQRAKDLENEAKEQEKQRKVEEEEKKHRAQLRLHNFFAAKPVPKPSPSKTAGLMSSAPTSPSAPEPPRISDYRTKFLPFTLATNARLPKNYVKKLQRQLETIDLTHQKTATEYSFGPSKRRGWEQIPVKDIMEQIQGTSKNPIDLTQDEQSRKRMEAVKMANRTAFKYLFFSQDIRPPYFGTYTTPLSLSKLRKLARNPQSKVVQNLDYEYDSEAEWEEEDGDEIGSDVEDEDEEDGEDDMEGFVDDTGIEDLTLKRQPMFTTDLTPICSGIQWEDEKGNLPSNGGDSPMDLGVYEMEFLLHPEPRTIDPFSTAYWETTSPQPKKIIAPTGRPALVDKTKQLNTVNGPQSLKAARYIPDTELDAFKNAIDGQDLTKIAMIEHLKKLFPKQAKDAIVNTLGAIAERESKKSNAKWRLKT